MKLNLTKKLVISCAIAIISVLVIYAFITPDYDSVLSTLSTATSLIAVVVAVETLTFVYFAEKTWRNKEFNRILIDNLALTKRAEIRFKNDLMTPTKTYMEIRRIIKREQIRGRKGTIKIDTESLRQELSDRFNDYIEVKATYTELRDSFLTKVKMKTKSNERAKLAYRNVKEITSRNKEFYQDIKKEIDEFNTKGHVSRSITVKNINKCRRLRNDTRAFNEALAKGTKMEIDERFSNGK